MQSFRLRDSLPMAGTQTLWKGYKKTKHTLGFFYNAPRSRRIQESRLRAWNQFAKYRHYLKRIPITSHFFVINQLCEKKDDVGMINNDKMHHANGAFICIYR